MDNFKPKAPHLIVFDLETTGLDPARDAIIEVGAIALDENFGIVGALDFVVRPAYAYQLEHMSDFVKEMHTVNGLLEVVQDGLAPHDADEKLACWLRYSMGCEDKTVVLAGHTISFDHGFIKAQFPLTAKLLSHRTLDFSAMSRLFRDCGIDVPNSEMPHRAMGDCLLEMDELKGMVDYLRLSQKQAGTIAECLASIRELKGRVSSALKASGALDD